MSHKKILIILLLLPLFVSATAQIGVRLHKPPPNKLKIPNLWHIDLDNSSENTYTVYLHAEVRDAKKGLVFRANSNDFSLPPGKKRITSKNIKEVRDVFYLKEYEDYIRKTNEFPPGSYTICIYVVESKTKEEIGKDCIEQEVKRIGKVRLISPKDGEVVKEDYPLFVWAPPSGLPAGAEITYNLRIVEVLSGQTKEEAMRANPAWFEQKEIKETSFRYPASARKFEKGKRYAWMVIGITAMIKYESEVWEFWYKERPGAGEVVIKAPAEGSLMSSVECIEVDVGGRKDIREVAFMLSWDGKKWEKIGTDKNPKDGWMIGVNTYAWVFSDTKEAYLKIVAVTKQGRKIETRPLKVTISN